MMCDEVSSSVINPTESVIEGPSEEAGLPIALM